MSRVVLGVDYYISLHNLIKDHLVTVIPQDPRYENKPKGRFVFDGQTYTTAESIAQCINVKQLMPKTVTASHISKVFDQLGVVHKFVRKAGNDEPKGRLSAVLSNIWKRIKEQDHQIKEQDRQIADLKNRIEELELGKDSQPVALNIPPKTVD